MAQPLPPVARSTAQEDIPIPGDFYDNYGNASGYKKNKRPR